LGRLLNRPVVVSVMVIFIVATTTIAAATSNSCKVLTLEEM
jgi:hypothetical protein